MQLKDQVALITGSTRGIGKGVAERMAEAGARVIILGRNGEMAAQVRDDLVGKGYQADAFGCDVTDMKNVQETVDKILDKHKSIDILVNNAGITRDNLLLRLSEEDWDEVIRVNLKGAFIVTKVVSKVMLKARKGKIISIASIIGITGNIGQANYAASKAGLIALSKSVAKELASRGITSNVIAPGYIETDMTGELSEKAREDIAQNIPVKRFGQVDDIAGVCLFLASKAADYITGQTIVVDGGLTV